jgi:hypothetical protein
MQADRVGTARPCAGTRYTRPEGRDRSRKPAASVINSSGNPEWRRRHGRRRRRVGGLFTGLRRRGRVPRRRRPAADRAAADESASSPATSPTRCWRWRPGLRDHRRLLTADEDGRAPWGTVGILAAASGSGSREPGQQDLLVGAARASEFLEDVSSFQS